MDDEIRAIFSVMRPFNGTDSATRIPSNSTN